MGGGGGSGDLDQFDFFFSKVKVGVLRPVQQPGIFFSRFKLDKDPSRDFFFMKFQPPAVLV